ncbi:MAG: LPS export ABC transporter permease LptF [Pseudomonadota bacterium]
MNAPTAISRYVFRELIPPFLISLLFLTFVFLMARIPNIINMVVNYNAGIASLLAFVVFLFPRVMEFAVPMSIMISVLLSFMRMSGDNEIIALKGSGISLVRLVPPVFMFCLLGTLFSLWITIWGVPWGNLSIKEKGMEIARSNLNVALKERSFNTSFKDVMIYVSSMDIKTKELEDIFIEDSRTQGRVVVSVAPRGILVSDNEQMLYTLRLFDGKVNQVDLNTQMVNTVHFSTYDINLDLGREIGSMGSQARDLDEMSLPDLLMELKRLSTITQVDVKALNTARMELHEKFSIPFACLTLGLLAMALGLQSTSTRHSSGFGMALFFVLVYYLLLAAGWSTGETGAYPPFLGMWIPNAVMAGAGIYLLRRAINERPVILPDRLIRRVLSLGQRWRRGEP